MPPLAGQIRIQYGGSVTPDNCKELITKPNIDGFLVGAAIHGDPIGAISPGFGAERNPFFLCCYDLLCVFSDV